MQCQIGNLPQQTALQCIDGDLQMLNRRCQRLNDGAFGVDRRIAVAQVILNQLIEAALIELVSDLLPWFEVKSGLIQAPTEALAILCDIPGDQAANNDTGYQ
jgi:hypothetical protein